MLDKTHHIRAGLVILRRRLLFCRTSAGLLLFPMAWACPHQNSLLGVVSSAPAGDVRRNPSERAVVPTATVFDESYRTDARFDGGIDHPPGFCGVAGLTLHVPPTYQQGRCAVRVTPPYRPHWSYLAVDFPAQHCGASERSIGHSGHVLPTFCRQCTSAPLSTRYCP